MAKGETKARGYNWMVGVAVLSLGWLLLYATRTALSSALKDIGDFWGLSEGYLGFLASSFFLSYMILQIPSGMLADRFGSRKMIAIGFGIQAAGLIFGVLARSPYQFLLARILTGAGQATYFACQQAILSFTLPPGKRAGGVAFTTAGAGLGSAVGFLLGKLLSAFSLGWKMPFVVLGILSGAFVVLVLTALPEPRHGVNANKVPSSQAAATAGARRAQDEGVSGQRAPNGGWAFLALMSLTHFLTMYGFYLMLTWLPYYLETVRGLKGGLSAVIPVVMPLIMAPSTIIWGNAADRKKRRDFVLRICLPISAVATAVIPLAGSPVLLAAVLALYGATGKLVIDPILVSTVSDNAPAHNRGAVLATFNSAASLAMILAPTATGLIAQLTGSFDVSFYAAGLFHLVALLAFTRGMRLLARSKADESGRPGQSANLTATPS